jgi:hypothetical protein
LPQRMEENWLRRRGPIWSPDKENIQLIID